MNRAEPGSVRILVVEDNAITALGLQLLLEDLGHAVCDMAATAPAAVAAAARHLPDLVLMDVQLADGTDGITAAREIRSRFDIPSLYVTANVDDATCRRAQDTLPLGFLSKPYSSWQLQTALQRAIDRLVASGA